MRSVEVIIKLRLRAPILLALFVFMAVHILAQSPNTASLIVVVADQNGAVVKDAKVSVQNAATGAAREADSGTDGIATISALPINGTYTVSVSREGFGSEQREGITLR